MLTLCTPGLLWTITPGLITFSWLPIFVFEGTNMPGSVQTPSRCRRQAHTASLWRYLLTAFLLLLFHFHSYPATCPSLLHSQPYRSLPQLSSLPHFKYGGIGGHSMGWRTGRRETGTRHGPLTLHPPEILDSCAARLSRATTHRNAINGLRMPYYRYFIHTTPAFRHAASNSAAILSTLLTLPV